MVLYFSGITDDEHMKLFGNSGEIYAKTLPFVVLK